MEQREIQQQALSNARNGQSFANYAAIFEGFREKGIPESSILPRENVFTFHAWKALGRQVRKGEHGVKVCTYVPMEKHVKDGDAEKVESFRAPRMTTVFHVSQTEPTNGARPVILEVSANAMRAKSAQVTADTGYYSDEFTPAA